MTVRGMQVYMEPDSFELERIASELSATMDVFGYKHVRVPSVAETRIFTERAGKEIADTLYTFKDKKGRDLCLIPEVTAVIRELYLGGWDKSMKKPVKLQYVQRCYRYDRPQEGRYREFTQFGVEYLGPINTEIMTGLKGDLILALNRLGLKDITLKDQVKRGLDYYIEDGFEVEHEGLGAQKQIAGGGKYDCGAGWAIGLERIMLALNHQNAIVEEKFKEQMELP